MPTRRDFLHLFALVARIANLTLVPHPSMLRDLNPKTAHRLQHGIKVINRL